MQWVTRPAEKAAPQPALTWSTGTQSNHFQQVIAKLGVEEHPPPPSGGTLK